MLSRLFSDSLSIDLPLKNGFGRLSFIIHNNYDDRSSKAFSQVERLTAFFHHQTSKIVDLTRFQHVPEKKTERIPTSSSSGWLALDGFSSLLCSTPVVCLFSFHLATHVTAAACIDVFVYANKKSAPILFLALVYTINNFWALKLITI